MQMYSYFLIQSMYLDSNCEILFMILLVVGKKKTVYLTVFFFHPWCSNMSVKVSCIYKVDAVLYSGKNFNRQGLKHFLSWSSGHRQS